jgi:hypothetical protein
MMGARKRSLDPGIWTDEGFLELSANARLFFIGLISNADDDGRGAAALKTLKSRIFPADEIALEAIAGYEWEVSKNTHTVFYEVEGISYYALLKWDEYQKIDHYRAGTCPPAPLELIKESFGGDSPNVLRAFAERSPNGPPGEAAEDKKRVDEIAEALEKMQPKGARAI